MTTPDPRTYLTEQAAIAIARRIKYAQLFAWGEGSYDDGVLTGTENAFIDAVRQLFGEPARQDAYQQARLLLDSITEADFDDLEMNTPCQVGQHCTCPDCAMPAPAVTYGHDPARVAAAEARVRSIVSQSNDMDIHEPDHLPARVWWTPGQDRYSMMVDLLAGHQPSWCLLDDAIRSEIEHGTGDWLQGLGCHWHTCNIDPLLAMLRDAGVQIQLDGTMRGWTVRTWDDMIHSQFIDLLMADTANPGMVFSAINARRESNDRIIASQQPY